MNKLIWIIVAILTCPEWTATASRIELAHGTLIIISATKSSIIVAADSGLTENGKVISATEKKIFPVGHDSACFFLGTVRVALKGKAELTDLAAAARAWIVQHPHIGTREAYQGLLNLILDKLAIVRTQRPDPHSLVSLGCAGFDAGIPILILSDIYLQTDAGPRVNDGDRPLPPGLVLPVGRAKVAGEILRGDGDALKSFKSEAAVTKYREARKNGTWSSLTESDLLSISSACLKATENRAGKDFDPEAADVSAPNHFAVIDAQTGFRWVPLP